MSTGLSKRALTPNSASPVVLTKSFGSNAPLNLAPSFSSKLCLILQALPGCNGVCVADNAAEASAPNLNSVLLHKNGVAKLNDGVAGRKQTMSPSAAPVGVA